MSNLIPCPFCESDNTKVTTIVTGTIFYVGCLTCSTLGPSGHTKEEAIEKWNAAASKPITEPCFYCGSEDASVVPVNGQYAVECWGCEARGPILPNRAEAIRTWNTAMKESRK